MHQPLDTKACEYGYLGRERLHALLRLRLAQGQEQP